ncbi:FHA domain-containing protein [Aquisalimonas lutea]|uniref:type VI secretion system-associated FHA domain protein n=1 Tax=Aquisalimonas lutea TaxID=1327750 RepID=UPI0025B4AFAA|nr:FHA domain-containing protein [Aquisalimonas lutea]MDN3519584.1 FHA domain-containing protein [Aquisalimonas lutea]
MRLRLDLQGDDDGKGHRPYHLVENVAVVGRAPACDWQLDCGERLVSRRHAFFSREGDHFVVYDASANGVYVNDAPEPLGEGQRAALSQGDRLQIGPYTLAVTLLDAPGEAGAPQTGSMSDVPEAPGPGMDAAPDVPAAPLQGPAGDTAARTTHVAASRNLGLGGTRDAFQPPSVTIPEDWDLEVAGSLDQNAEGGLPSLGQQLETLEPEVARGLIEGLGHGAEDIQSLELSRQQAYALGASMRETLACLMAVRRELDDLEQRLPTRADRSLPGSSVRRDADHAIRRLVAGDDDQAREELSRIQAVTADLPGRPKRIVAVLNNVASGVVRLFEPRRFEQRAKRAVETDAGTGLRSLWCRLTLRLAPSSHYWREFRSWHAERGDRPEGVVQSLFEKRLKKVKLGHQDQGGGARKDTASSDPH